MSASNYQKQVYFPSSGSSAVLYSDDDSCYEYEVEHGSISNKDMSSSDEMDISAKKYQHIRSTNHNNKKEFDLRNMDHNQHYEQESEIDINFDLETEDDLIDFTSAQKDKPIFNDDFMYFDTEDERIKLQKAYESILNNKPESQLNINTSDISTLTHAMLTVQNDYYSEKEENQMTLNTEKNKKSFNIKEELLSMELNDDFMSKIYNGQNIQSAKAIGNSQKSIDLQSIRKNIDSTTSINSNPKSKSLYDLYKGNGIFSNFNNIFSEPLKPAPSSGWVFKWGNFLQKNFNPITDNKADMKFQLKRSIISQPKQRMWGFDDKTGDIENNDIMNLQSNIGNIVGSKNNKYLKEPTLPVEVFLLPSTQSTDYIKNNRHSIGANVLLPTLTSGGKSLQMSTQISLSKFDQRIKL
ncbi:hypothetical protein BB561_001516 [Smittium simulii]|uniref:Uncharacterized protein n=1 Tax=Smittium simulii TaxID=133385 RepID=A0A2T9YUC5_9FUNG|nr:hypothetical protein BB561_001516 [Smittium simulii]